MIKFKSKFQIYDSANVSIPRVKGYKGNFWCSFNTKMQLIMCSIIYMGKDKNMQQNKWYDGIVELPYGEKFLPYCNKSICEFSEPINLYEQYYLNVGSEIVGQCELLEIIEIINDDFAISKDKNSNY